MGYSMEQVRRMRRNLEKTGVEQSPIPTVNTPSVTSDTDGGKDALRNAWIGQWRIITGGKEWPFVPEQPITSVRDWLFDDYNAFHPRMHWVRVAIEYDGKCHTNIDRWERDAEKMNMAAMHDIVVIHLTWKMIHEDPVRWVRVIERMIDG